ncbi:zinc-ribbon domain-containing protein [Kitasatospora hibisci]|uniref:zinc-ribbon domain-containing protein n=1 Tax=Kitasatospora hibisci TaxID=3369522 RepID=UPI003754847F
MSATPGGKAVQLCSEPECSRPAAFRTRSRPTWCDDHITEILREGGLEPLEPFDKPTAWRLTRCLVCGCEAHYRFQYTLDNNAHGEATCRACYWRTWARESRERLGPDADLAPVPTGAMRAHAEQHGYDYLGPLTDPSLPDDPHRVRCRYCGRLSADRPGDIAFGCRCQTNPRRDRQTTNVSGPRQRDLLKDSGLPVLDWWDHEANDTATWETVSVRGHREAAWRCPACGLRFRRKVLDMVHVRQCPDCEPRHRAAREAEYERHRVTPVAEVPELLAAWADEADPHTVTVVDDGPPRRFRCPQGHHPRLAPRTYLKSGCPSCTGLATRAENQAIADTHRAGVRLNPEIAAQWHPELNGDTRPAKVSPGSRKAVWWQDPNCGHVWQDAPAGRDKGQRLRCPECRTILDSLAFHFPELAAEWSPENPVTAWHVRPTGQTPFVPVWLCAANPEHVWQAALASRSNGSGCPECRVPGKSQVELDHHAAAERAFGRAASGRSVRHEAFVRRGSWIVDITVEQADGRLLAIEYDGSYWHADKVGLDTDKSRNLLAAGYLVARLREHPLPPLPIGDPAYAEFPVHSATPDPDGAIARVRAWTLGSGAPV